MAWKNIDFLDVWTYRKEIPTVAADIVSEDVYITRIFIGNPTAGTVVVTLKDKGSTPTAFQIVPGASIPANSVWHSEFKVETALLAEGGLNLVCDTAAVDIMILGRYDARA